MIVVSSARVATERASAYLKQLCEHFAEESRRHFGQEIVVTLDGDEGFVDFSPFVSGAVRLHAREKGLLVLEASATDGATLKRLQGTLTEHTERFGRRDGLRVEWGPASEQP